MSKNYFYFISVYFDFTPFIFGFHLIFLLPIFIEIENVNRLNNYISKIGLNKDQGKSFKIENT